MVCIYGPSYDDKGWCTGTNGKEVFTVTVDAEQLPEDGEGDWNVQDFGIVESNDVDFDTYLGAGIGQEFAHSIDEEANEWNIWWWNDGSEGDFIEAEHEVYII